jgi:methylglyoxal synthase
MDEKKTYIGVLASHDHPQVNKDLVSIFDDYSVGANRKILRNFHFIFTGGTFDRVILGSDKDITSVNKETKRFLIDECKITRLPIYEEGGVTILSYFVTQRLCSIIWPFFSAKAHHWRRPENLAQWRLCDQWNVKRLANSGSVRRWLSNEALKDADKNKQKCPPELTLREGAKCGEITYYFEKNKSGYYEIKKAIEIKNNKKREISIDNFKKYISMGQQELISHTKKFEEMTVALIAHDEMKQRMISFAIDHEWELRKFGTILATGTTGREVAAATSEVLSGKIYRYHSGPKGGDIEIATEILFGRCHIVIFFVDPLHPHPHIDDIKTVFEACLNREGVMMITNEMHAREFMGNVVRAKDSFD